ncbi:MAG: PqiC family protein [Puniceicoccales bacterium]|nr:PqiC family protein [Puniceicoccales bacterium]
MKKVLFAIFAVLFCSGCTTNIIGKPRPDRTRVYLLQSTDDEQTLRSPAVKLPFKPEIIVGINPIEVPAYLNSFRLIYKKESDTNNRIFQHDFMRWGEPLAAGLGRIICQYLTAALPQNWVVVAPWALWVTPDVVLQITVEDWMPTLPDGVLLRIRCEFRAGREKCSLYAKSYSDFVALGVNSTEESIVHAMHEMANKFAAELANDARDLMSLIANPRQP